MDHDDCEADIDTLREALEQLLPCVEQTSAAREVGTEAWLAVHEARLALERTAP